MTLTKLVSVKAITPKKQMANLKKVAKEYGRDSAEYKKCLDDMTKTMLDTLAKAGG